MYERAENNVRAGREDSAGTQSKDAYTKDAAEPSVIVHGVCVHCGDSETDSTSFLYSYRRRQLLAQENRRDDCRGE